MEKLALIMKEITSNKVEVYTMEVPCCHAIHMMVMRAIDEAHKEGIDTRHYIVRVGSGKIEEYKARVIDESMIEAEKRAHGHAH